MHCNTEKRAKRETRGRSGFSLIEIMLVVVIMGILATVVVVNIGGQSQQARINATRTSIDGIGKAVEMYEMQTGELPSSLSDLTRSIGNNPPLIRGGVPSDSWGTPFSYSRKGDFEYEIRSAGPDRQPGTDADITN